AGAAPADAAPDTAATAVTDTDTAMDMAAASPAEAQADVVTDPGAEGAAGAVSDDAGTASPLRRPPLAELRDPVGSEVLRGADLPPVAPAAALAPQQAPLPRGNDGDSDAVEPQPAPPTPDERPAQPASPQVPALLAETADPEP